MTAKIQHELSTRVFSEVWMKIRVQLINQCGGWNAAGISGRPQLCGIGRTWRHTFEFALRRAIK